MDITIPELGISVGIFATFLMAGKSVCFATLSRPTLGPTYSPAHWVPLPSTLYERFSRSEVYFDALTRHRKRSV